MNLFYFLLKSGVINTMQKNWDSLFSLNAISLCETKNPPNSSKRDGVGNWGKNGEENIR